MKSMKPKPSGVPLAIINQLKDHKIHLTEIGGFYLDLFETLIYVLISRHHLDCLDFTSQELYFYNFP